MTKPSPEIEAVVRRWLEVHRDNESRPLINVLSTSEHLRYMGTAPDEFWGGSLLRRGLAQHVLEVPDWTALIANNRGLRTRGCQLGDLAGRYSVRGA